jgi:CspA family cold shock protein
MVGATLSLLFLNWTMVIFTCRGFGFISPDDGGDDLFAHHSQIKSDGQFAMLQEGQVVEYEAGISDRSGKPAAKNITGV